MVCVKVECLLKLLSKITRSVRLRDIVRRINSGHLSKKINTIYVYIYSKSWVKSYTIYCVIDTFTEFFV
jgi:hypothetical protein